MIEFDERDSTSVLYVKLFITILTLLVVAYSTIGNGIKVIKLRNRKIGFGKGN
jgi:hypothetical protein